jgi:hypothetical protein
MNIAQISDNLEKLVESFNKDSFIFDLLLAFGTPKATIARLQLCTSDSLTPSQAITKAPDTVVIKKKMYFKSVENEDLQTLLDTLETDEKVAKQAPRFILVTNFETLLAYDTKTDESLDIPILDIAQHYDFFLPWAGMEKAQHATENPADVKAAERMAKLYDEIKKDNPTNTKEEVHNLNVFLSRLLFCFFAEDTGIFEKNVFTRSVDSHTQTDGSDLNVYLDRLFVVMNTPSNRRDAMHGVSTMPAYLNAFPYVNGGLFRYPHTAPTFTRRSRQMLIDSGNLQWQDINPDIFGSMIQAVITPEHRGGLGMHYTSVPNIMKVIEPLFLDELKEEFENSKGNVKRLNALLQRIWKIKIFDPACGSGNFLIIAYKELRKLEMLLFKELGTFAFSEINLGNFYGIELDDFAHEVATLSLWLAEHQMNQEFMREFGRVKPALPLQETGNIVHGNACRIDWETVCPKNEGDEIYILGNPPYLGSSLTSDEQKQDMDFVFVGIKDFKKLDYIACWFYKGSNYIKNIKSKFAYVSTNSICQGEQVWMLWPLILANKQSIAFAYNSFNWSNNAKDKAGVTVIIVGITNNSNVNKKLLLNKGLSQTVNNISPYLISGASIFVFPRRIPLSTLPEMVSGSKPTDGGFLILSVQDKHVLTKENSNAYNYIKKYVGADDFINDNIRFCLWISDDKKSDAETIAFIKNRIDSCKEFRESSKKDATKLKAIYPHRFDEVKHQNSTSIIFPITTSYRRRYVPIGFLDSSSIISNSALAIYDAEPYMFSILSSRLNVIWLSVTGSRMRNDYRYSVNYCYNNFPFPTISDKQKKELEQHVYNILGEREKHSEKTLAQLYDPDKMPAGLREAHRQNDLAVERCYRSKPFESDEERLEYLFKLYEQMIEEEKEKGTLFGSEKKEKKKK